MNRYLLVLSLLLAASGCTTTPLVGTTPRPAPAPAPTTAPRPPAAEAPRAPSTADQRGGSAAPSVAVRPGPAVPEPSPPPATASVALLEQSRTERAAGSYAAAASSIERALRIEPNSALLWLELGEIKLADDDPQQAQQMARKAISLAGADWALTTRAERLIGRAATCAAGGC